MAHNQNIRYPAPPPPILPNVRFGTTTPTPIAGDKENDTYVRTSNGLATGTVIGTWVFDATSGLWIAQSVVAIEDEVTVTGVPMPVTFPVTTLLGTPIFSPNSPADTTKLYSITDGVSVQYAKWNGTQYISSPAPSVGTEFVLSGTATDAFSNKTANISRTGSIAVGSTSAPNTTVDIYGSFANNHRFSSTAANTITATDTVLSVGSLAGATGAALLPNAAAFPRRYVTIKTAADNAVTALTVTSLGGLIESPYTGTLSGSAALSHTTTKSATWQSDGTNWQLINENSNAAACPAPMTRTALISLRNASGLSKDCDYVITDHVQGRLVAGTTIHLQAVSANQLSENVSVSTTYDNEAWTGVYDIDRALVLELRDNRMNVARGINGVEVSGFDWGNTAYTNVLVDSSTLTVTYGAAAVITNVKIENGSSVTLTGFTGTLNHVNFDIVSIGNLSNANGSWRYFEIKDNSVLNINGYTGGGDNYYNTIDRTSSVNFSASSSPVILRQTTITASSVSHIGVSAGTFTLTTSTVEQSTINHATGAGAFTCSVSNIMVGANIQHILGTMSLSSTVSYGATIQQGTNAGAVMSLSIVEVSQGSNITNQSIGTLSMTRSYVLQASTVNRVAGSTGNLTFNASTLENSSSITHNATNTANTVISNSQIHESSNIQNSGGALLNITRVTHDGGSAINVIGGSGGTLSLTDVSIFNGTITKAAASTAGILAVSGGTVINSGSFIQTAGTGNITVTAGVFQGISGINCTSGDRGYTFNRPLMSGVGRANLSGTGAVTDTFDEITLADRGSLAISCSGAANQFSYSRIAGLSGSVTLSGTTGGKSMNRIKCNDGSVNIPNSPNASSISLFNVSDAGSITLGDNAAGDSLSYFDVSNGSQLIVNKTGAGSVQYIQVKNAGTCNILGTTTTISKLDVEQGALVFNGGSGNIVSKKMQSTFTVNGGAQSSVSHWNTVSKTTAVANTGRVDYLGVVSTVPIV